MQAIQDLDKTLDDYRTGTNLSAADREHNRELKRRVLHGTFDIRELCRLSLADHWIERTPAEQDHMVDVMTSLMEEKAVLSKEQGQKKSGTAAVYQIRYVGEQLLNAQKTDAFVKTRVNVPSEKTTVNLNYKLHRSGGLWKIYDVIVDDSSLVDNYADQFSRIIEKDGFPELMRRMEKKLSEIRAN